MTAMGGLFYRNTCIISFHIVRQLLWLIFSVVNLIIFLHLNLYFSKKKQQHLSIQYFLEKFLRLRFSAIGKKLRNIRVPTTELNFV